MPLPCSLLGKKLHKGHGTKGMLKPPWWPDWQAASSLKESVRHSLSTISSWKPVEPSVWSLSYNHLLKSVFVRITDSLSTFQSPFALILSKSFRCILKPKGKTSAIQLHSLVGCFLLLSWVVSPLVMWVTSSWNAFLHSECWEHACPGDLHFSLHFKEGLIKWSSLQLLDCKSF